MQHGMDKVSLSTKVPARVCKTIGTSAPAAWTDRCLWPVSGDNKLLNHHSLASLLLQGPAAGRKRGGVAMALILAPF